MARPPVRATVDAVVAGLQGARRAAGTAARVAAIAAVAAAVAAWSVFDRWAPAAGSGVATAVVAVVAFVPAVLWWRVQRLAGELHDSVERLSQRGALAEEVQEWRALADAVRARRTGSGRLRRLVDAGRLVIAVQRRSDTVLGSASAAALAGPRLVLTAGLATGLLVAVSVVVVPLGLLALVI